MFYEEKTSALQDVRRKHAMNETGNKRGIFSRQPLSTLGKLSVTALLGGALSSGGLALLIGLPDNVPLLITTAALLLVAGLPPLMVRRATTPGRPSHGPFFFNNYIPPAQHTPPPISQHSWTSL